MTVVVAIRKQGEIIMAGDNAAGWADPPEIYRLAGPEKVFALGPYLMGYTASFRIKQAVMRGGLPEPEGDAYEHMCLRFVPALRDLLRLEALDPREWLRVPLADCLLVAFDGRLFGVSADLAVMERSEEISVGVGRPWAYGSLHSTRGRNPATRLRLALEAAEEYCPCVRGPFHGYRLSGSTVTPLEMGREGCAAAWQPAHLPELLEQRRKSSSE